MTRKSPFNKSSPRALYAGYMSGLEKRVQDELTEKGVDCQYEAFYLPYVKPEKSCRYTPDFVLPNGIIIETKGRFVTSDRQKHLMIQKQYPELDIRFVFSNPKTKIGKLSKTSYADWCDKFGFKYAAKSVPDEWLNEPSKGDNPQLKSKG